MRGLRGGGERGARKAPYMQTLSSIQAQATSEHQGWGDVLGGFSLSLPDLGLMKKAAWQCEKLVQACT